MSVITSIVCVRRGQSGHPDRAQREVLPALPKQAGALIHGPDRPMLAALAPHPTAWVPQLIGFLVYVPG